MARAVCIAGALEGPGFPVLLGAGLKGGEVRGGFIDVGVYRRCGGEGSGGSETAKCGCEFHLGMEK